MFDSPSELISNNNKEIKTIWHKDLIDQTEFAIDYAIARAAASMLLDNGICACMFHKAMQHEMEFRGELDMEEEEWQLRKQIHG